MKGVMMAEVSAGSNHVGASEICTAQVIWPEGASARPRGASERPTGACARLSRGQAPTSRIPSTSDETKRPRTSLMEASVSFALELHVFVRPRPQESGDEPQARFLHAGALGHEGRVQPDR